MNEFWVCFLFIFFFPFFLGQLHFPNLVYSADTREKYVLLEWGEFFLTWGLLSSMVLWIFKKTIH